MIKKAVWFVAGWRLDCSSSGLGSSDLEFPKSFGRILENSFFRLSSWDSSVSPELWELVFLSGLNQFVRARSQAMIVPEEALILSDKKPSSEYFGNYFSELCLILFCLFPFSAKPIRAGHHPGVANPAVSSLHLYCTWLAFEMVGRKRLEIWLWS